MRDDNVGAAGLYYLLALPAQTSFGVRSGDSTARRLKTGVSEEGRIQVRIYV